MVVRFYRTKKTTPKGWLCVALLTVLPAWLRILPKPQRGPLGKASALCASREPASFLPASSLHHKKTTPKGWLCVAQRRGFEPPDESPPSHDFQSCSLNHSDISARNKSYFTTIPPKMQLLFIRFLHFSVSEMKKYFCPCISPSHSISQ